MELDDIDWRLLDALQHDASLSNQALAERLRLSPPTALRRVRRLREAGLIAAQVALLDEDRVAAAQGHGLTALAEVSLDRQGAEQLDAYQRLAERLFTQDANVRNVRVFFATRRAKFQTQVPLARGGQPVPDDE